MLTRKSALERLADGSSLTARELAGDFPGCQERSAAAILRELERDGGVEQIRPPEGFEDLPARYRLPLPVGTPAGVVVTYTLRVGSGPDGQRPTREFAERASLQAMEQAGRPTAAGATRRVASVEPTPDGWVVGVEDYRPFGRV